MKKPQILVIGFGGTHCTDRAYNLAYKVGEEIAEHGAILVTGGLGGVMEAASRGAKSGGWSSCGNHSPRQQGQC